MSHVLRRHYFLLAGAHLAVAAWGAMLIRRGAFMDLHGAGVPLLEAAAVAAPLLMAWILIRRGCTRLRPGPEGLDLIDPLGRLHLTWRALRLTRIDSRNRPGRTPHYRHVLLLPGSARPTALRNDDFVGLEAACQEWADRGWIARWTDSDLDDETYHHLLRLVRRRRFEIAGWILSAACGLTLWSAAYGLYCERQVNLNGAVANAVVVGKVPAARWALLGSGRLVYEFEVPGRGHFVGRAGVEPALWNRVRAGSELPVRYLSGLGVRSRPVGVHESRLVRLGVLVSSTLGLFLFGCGSAVASAPLKRPWLHAG